MARRYKAGLRSSLLLLLFLLTVLLELLPEAPSTLRPPLLLLFPGREGLDLSLGATITSALGAILTNGTSDPAAGSRDATLMLAVEVGETCRAKGCAADPGTPPGGANAGLGSARTWDIMLSSRKLACSSMTSQSSGVRGSMCTVCAIGNSRWIMAVIFWPSLSPRVFASVGSISTSEISCSRDPPKPREPWIPSRVTIGASLRLLGRPVQPRSPAEFDDDILGMLGKW
ncbi:hypothetical protein PoMZ_10322 [Pyricularia oryzae]|uniref:Uncharacterized protein n=1 Tax=Pyricularia oryzae TaxID=318829 RepID=A0A4P7N1Z1_PYROR|nr:hypothetical protein PoMZ_10322 [Pyricularia oryzae]